MQMDVSFLISCLTIQVLPRSHALNPAIKLATLYQARNTVYSVSAAMLSTMEVLSRHRTPNVIWLVVAMQLRYVVLATD